jgi:hypothetical protein
MKSFIDSRCFDSNKVFVFQKSCFIVIAMLVALVSAKAKPQVSSYDVDTFQQLPG